MIIEYQKNFQRTEGCKMISPHHFHPTNGVRPLNVHDDILEGCTALLKSL